MRGLVVFIDNDPSPGERAKIRITKVEDAYATGEVLNQVQKNENEPSILCRRDRNLNSLSSLRHLKGRKYLEVQWQFE